MRKTSVLFVVSAIALSAPWAWAQRPPGRGGFGGGLNLLGQESVQKELKLSDDQLKKVEEQLAKQRESFSGLRDLSREERQQKLDENGKANQAALASILNEDQLKRFKQISLQQRGGAALADSEVAAALALSDEQKSKIGEIQSAAREEMRGLFQGDGGGDREAMRKKFEEARAATNEKFLGILTPEQQTKWKEMTGEPFKGEIRAPARGGNRRRGNRDDAARASRPGFFRLTSFRDDDADAADADDEKNADAKKREADKPRSKPANGRAGDARRRGRPGRAEAGRGGDAGRFTDRSRAWSHVARAMGQRGRGAGRPGMARRGGGRGFADAGHRGHGPSMAWGMHHERGAFGSPRGHGPESFAGFHGRRGPGHFGFAAAHHRPGTRGPAWFGGHRGPMMAHHRGPHHHHGHSMAGRGGFRGHHEPQMAHRPGHDRPGPHAMAARPHHHGPPPASLAGHHGRGHMHMAGFKKHRPHGRSEMGKHGQHRPDGDASRRRGGDDDRDGDRRHQRDDD